MHDNHMTQVRTLLEESRRYVGILLDMSKVPDGHPLERQAWGAFESLERVLRKIEIAAPRVTRGAGPVVYPLPGEDPRRWPTYPKGPWTLPRGAVDPEWTGLCLKAPLWATRSRVLAWSEYLRALREATPRDALAVARHN
jgi:hypothetical protein